MLLAAQATVVANDVPLRASVNVPAVPAVLVITILVTTVVVAEGTVYSVPDDVANAPRPNALVVVAISYYLSYIQAPMSVMSTISCSYPLASSDAYVVDTILVKPLIVVTVAPEPIDVEPSVGAV